MHFSTEAVPAEIPVQMTRLVSITGWKLWKRRLAWLQQQVRANPTMEFFLHKRFGLELAFAQVRRHQNLSGRYPWPPETAEQQRLYSFLAMIVRCHNRLNQTGRTRLEGMIEDALKSDYGFAPLAFEMKIVAHLMTRGFNVKFHDMEEGSGCDCVVDDNGFKIEVECKFVSGDIGRQIHLKKLHQLGTVLLDDKNKFLDQGCKGRLYRVLIPGRLRGDNKQHQEVRDLVLRAYISQTSVESSDGYQVSMSIFSVADSPFGRVPPTEISTSEIERFLSDEFGIENKNVLIQFNPKKGAVLVSLESAKKDTVLKGIHRQLKNTARGQLSRDRPGILCCELADLTEDQLRALGNDQNEDTGREYMVSDLMARRPQIHSLVFTTPGTVRIERARSESSIRTSVQEIGPAYTFRNAFHPLADDPRCDFF